MCHIISIRNAVNLLHQKQIIAYPTESIYGLGCDPDNEKVIKKLLQLKKRSMTKGLILIAASFEMLRPYIDESVLTEAQKRDIMATWPGPVTWLLPKSKHVSTCLSGKFDCLAVRITAHETAKNLCRQYGKPIISTSANYCGQAPCHTPEEISHYFGSDFPIVEGRLGKRKTPSQIRDSRTGKIIRI